MNIVEMAEALPLIPKTERLNLDKGMRRVYALYLEGKIQYVGFSQNVRHRLGSHTIKYDAFRLFPAPRFNENTELAVILALRAPENRNRGPWFMDRYTDGYYDRLSAELRLKPSAA